MQPQKNNVQLLSKFWLQAAREAALEDISIAQVQFGLPQQFLEHLRDLPLDRLHQITETMSVLPFSPRLPHNLLMRLLREPGEANLATVIQGAKHACAVN